MVPMALPGAKARMPTSPAGRWEHGGRRQSPESGQTRHRHGIDASDHDTELPRVPRRALTESTRSLGALLQAGLPLTRALETTRDVGDQRLAPVLNEVLDSVRGGSSLAGALAAHPDTFPALYVGVLRAGERSGRLAAMTDRLADEMERQQELREKIVSTLIYPLLLAVFGIVAVAFRFLYLLPELTYFLESTLF